MTMPGLTGAETFEALRAVDPNVLVLLTSGYDITATARQLCEQDGVHFIQKPWNLAQLRQAFQVLEDNR